MAEIDNRMVYEILKKLQGDTAKGFADIGVRMDKLEERMAHLEPHQTASSHAQQSIMAHLASIHGSIDSLRADLTGMDRRVAALEAR